MTTWREPKPRPYAMARRGVWVDGRVGKPALRVYLEMESAAARDRLCWLSVETIAERLTMEERAVQKARQELKGLGKIQFVGYRTMPGRGLAVAVYRMLGEAQPAPNELDTPAGRPAPNDLHTPAADPPRPNVAPAPANLGSRPVQFGYPPRPNRSPNQEGMHERRNEDDDEERARGTLGASSSSAPLDDFSDEGQALLIFDELASRMGWPIARRLTSKERKALSARLRDAGELPGWRLAMEKAEASNYLRKTKPGLPFFLKEDNFAQLVRGQYDPEHDPPLRGRDASMAAMAAALGGLASQPSATAESATPRQPADAAPADPAPAPASPSPLQTNLSVIGRYTGKTDDQMGDIAQGWLQRLEAVGIDPSTAREIIASEARKVPKTHTALERMEERIVAHVEAKAA